MHMHVQTHIITSRAKMSIKALNSDKISCVHSFTINILQCGKMTSIITAAPTLTHTHTPTDSVLGFSYTKITRNNAHTAYITTLHP